jgi:hypothetical protein
MKRKNLAALVLIGILLAAVVFAPVPGRALGIKTLHDFAHAPIFGCVALLTLFAFGSHEKFSGLSLRLQYLGAFLIAITLGALTEIAQIPVGRDASWMDLRSDVLGAAGFPGLYATFDPRIRRPTIRALGMAAGVSLLAIHSMPLAAAVKAYLNREQTFPVLADFTQGLDSYFIKAQWAALDLRALPERWARQPGELAMRVTFAQGPWPGIDFAEPAPDWRGYTNLAIDITNPSSAELVLGMRVHDVQHNQHFEDRFNRTLHVPPMTRTVLRIPIADIQSGPQTRRMDLQQIVDYLMFRSRESAVQEMYVARVWLE